LSEVLGTYRETVTQTLNDFKAEGLIEIGRKRIALQNIERLWDIAEE
jgi:CRP-like cAMP-binding protein